MPGSAASSHRSRRTGDNRISVEAVYGKAMQSTERARQIDLAPTIFGPTDQCYRRSHAKRDHARNRPPPFRIAKGGRDHRRTGRTIRPRSAHDPAETSPRDAARATAQPNRPREPGSPLTPRRDPPTAQRLQRMVTDLRSRGMSYRSIAEAVPGRWRFSRPARLSLPISFRTGSPRGTFWEMARQ